MSAKNLTLAGKRFVILTAEEYRLLRKRAANAPRRRIRSADDRDAAEALRRLNDAADVAIPYETARKKLGLK